MTVVDPIERRRYRLETPEPVDVQSTTPDEFRFPVETAAIVETDRVDLPSVVSTFVRDDDGEMIGELQQSAEASFPDRPCSVEFETPIKLYLRVEGPFDVSTGTDSVTVQLSESQPVAIGARSRHERPAATVRTTGAPEDLLAAISTFGSALKTTSPERSFPTLRGHPPEIELGDALDVPAGLEPPADDVVIEVPAEYEYVYPIAPLAYYLGAPVRPGPDPRVVTDEFVHDLDGEFRAAVEETLQQVFFLECVTRTEGLYPLDLHERTAIEGDVDLAFGDLYDAPQAERLAEFLAVPYDVVAPHVPDWPMVSRVAPGSSAAETLPYLVDDLALVRTCSGRRVAPDEIRDGNLHGMVRGASQPAETTYVRSGGDSDALTQTWVGEGMPVDASKAVREAYRNRIGRTPDDGDIEILVVCNDAEMDTERDAVDQVYGSRDDVQFDVTIHRDLSCDDLAAALARDSDLFHYIGHIDDGGFRCTDGHYDAGEADDVGLDAFMLNACRSYEQGLGLLQAGAIGGIVTLSDVVNLGAVRIGKQVARLLDCGFPLHAALDVARDESVVGAEYNVIGDGSLQVTQSDCVVPLLLELERDGSDWKVTYQTYTPGSLGAICHPLVAGNDSHYLASGRTGTFDVTMEEVEETVSGSEIPVRHGGSIYYTADSLAASL